MNQADANAAGASKERPGDPGTLLFENDRVKVWELIMRPGEICNWHVHETDHLLVVFDGAQIEAARENGARGERLIEDREVLFIPSSPIAEIARNASPDRTLRELIIEFKDPKHAATESGKFHFFRDGTPTTTWVAPLPSGGAA
jgi:hypothetical protein